jgi:ABC-type polysaccharide/polyol phosphate export permease
MGIISPIMMTFSVILCGLNFVFGYRNNKDALAIMKIITVLFMLANVCIGVSCVFLFIKYRDTSSIQV